MPKQSFTITDLRGWREKGLLTEEQLQRIIAEADLETVPETPPETAERRTRLNPVTVAYYFGGFLALLSFFFFLTMRWEELSATERFISAFAVVIVTACLGAWLRFARDYRTAGSVILLITAALFPMLVYTIADMAGLWPGTGSFESLSYGFLYLSLISLPVALLILVLTRFPLITLVAAGLVHFICLALGGIAGADLPMVTAAACGGLVLVAFGMTLRGLKSYDFWLKLYALVGLQVGFTILWSNSNSVWLGILFLAVYLVILFASLRFQEIIYLVFGLIGVYTYVIRLVFDYLEDTAYFPLFLGLVGISIVVLAILFQRYHGKLFHRRA